MNNEEYIGDTRKEVLDALYEEAIIRIFNKAVKDNNITDIHATGMDMKDPKVMLKIASIIGINSENGLFDE